MQENISLKNYTTLRLGGTVRYFFVCKNEEDIAICVNFAQSRNLPIFPLGGGSNIVVLDELSDMVCMKLENKGIEIINENAENVLVRVRAGEIWDDFVHFAVENNFSGIEALTMIPGTVGASPIQNIGAYGTEVSDTIENVRGFNIEQQRLETLSKTDCQFGYRISIFKGSLRGKFVIESVFFRLHKKSPIIPAYPLVSTTLTVVQAESPGESLLKQIRMSIKRIRSDKLPDPVKIPNVGSFFKNVFVDKQKYSELTKVFPDIPNFPGEQMYKIPTGWLIEQCGYKGYTLDGVSVYQKNALVLVNNSAEKTEVLLSLARNIQSGVEKKFGLQLEIEPEIIV